MKRMNNSFKTSIDKYIRECKTGKWIEEEAYKFEFANFIFNNVDLEKQSDSEILEVFKKSQKLKYTAKATGVQFILKSGRENLKDFVSNQDIELLKELKFKQFQEVDWSNRTMSFTGLSAWVGSLFPEKLYPIPMTGFDQTIKYLFGNVEDKFPKQGINYLTQCQPYLETTWEYLSQYPIESLFINEWNKYYKTHEELNIPLKEALSTIDKVWLVQDFHLFVHRRILNLYKPKKKEYEIQEIVEPFVIEGETILAQHLRKERNSNFIRKLKKQAIENNKMLNCEVCGFSFFEQYGELGEGFIEAHHKNPLAEKEVKTKTMKEDIALICSNCHRMVHRSDSILSIKELQEILIKNAL